MILSPNFLKELMKNANDVDKKIVIGAYVNILNHCLE